MSRILLCDDSLETLKILSFLIDNKDLGDVIEEVDDGYKALEIIDNLSPDLVITEYVLKGLDGNELIRKAKKNSFKGKFIMVSGIYDPEVVSKAYENGASFFIRKPININETIHIISSALKMARNEKLLDKFRDLLYADDFIDTSNDTMSVMSVESEIEKVLISLGLHGRSGYQEIKEMVFLSYSDDDKGIRRNLTEMYQKVGQKLDEKPKTVEQKIRRAAQKALDFIAIKGIEDYDSLVFDRYASTLFDFGEVRKNMNMISGKGKTPGSLQIRKFIEGIKIIVQEG